MEGSYVHTCLCWRNKHGLAALLICSMLRGCWLLKSTCPPTITNAVMENNHFILPCSFGTALNIVKTIQANLCHGSLIFQTVAKSEEQLTNSECVRQNPISPRFSKIQRYYILSHRLHRKGSVHVTTLFGCDVDPGYQVPLVADHSLQARLRHFTNSSTASKLCACPSTPDKCST